MDQLALFSLAQRVYSVSEINRRVRSLLEDDDLLQEVWVRGEVSNVSHPKSGHLYFTLKDGQAALRCVMWRPDVLRLVTVPREGEAVEARGQVSVYEAGGQYQLYAQEIRPAGEGALYLEFMQLKARLEAEGLFAAERKQRLPAWPQRIGVVTSPDAAALQDVLTVLGRRAPPVEVILCPTPVQGAEAPAGIVRALGTLNRRARPDVILLVRGGGSIEDLWAFNTEEVARAIAASAAPVISGVGHETDVTIADFAADVRAATPSAAAEIATPDRRALQGDLRDAARVMRRMVERHLHAQRGALREWLTGLRIASPRAQLANARQRVDDLGLRAAAAVRTTLRLHGSALSGARQALVAFSPVAVLERGYALVSLPGGGIVRSVRQVRAGTRLAVRVSDGTFDAEANGPAAGAPPKGR
jgi:exodeoxyribonuclease VII large subunit